MDAVRFAGDVIGVKRSRRGVSRFFVRAALAAAVGPVVLSLVGAVLSNLGADFLMELALQSWIGGWLVGTPVATILALVAGSRRALRASSVDVDDEALRLRDGEAVQAIARRQVTGALHVAGRGDDVEITLENGDVLHVEVATPIAARALVAALGFGAAERRTVVLLGDDHDALAAGCWGVLLGVLATTVATCGLAVIPTHFVYHVAGYLIGFVFIATSLFFARALAPKRVVVGTDGLLVDRTFGRRFLPLSAIRAVKADRQGLFFAITDGKASREIAITAAKGDRAAALRERILEAMANAGRAGEEASSALMARSGRSIGAWREALRRLVQSGGYRGETVSIDTLLRLAESAEAPAEQRIGAALAIGLAEDAAAKQRLRIAVDGIANETMRLAMERAAAGAEDEAAIEEAIAAEAKAGARR
ncbi:MAG: hypothetical protein QM820_57670 [Minicystis sp.]